MLVYIITSEGSQPVILRPHPGPHTAHYVQLSHFIYFSPSSASTEGEYGILEPKFPDGGHCQSVLRRQCVLLLPPSSQGRRHLRFYVICEPRGVHLLMLKLISYFYRQHRGSNPGPLACGSNALYTDQAALRRPTPDSTLPVAHRQPIVGSRWWPTDGMTS